MKHSASESCFILFNQTHITIRFSLWIFLQPVSSPSHYNKEPLTRTAKRNKHGKLNVGSPRYCKPLKRSCSVNVTPMVIPPTGKEEKVLSLTMETVPHLNSFVGHLMGFKAQPLETHIEKGNQCPSRPRSELAQGFHTAPSFNRCF